MLSWTPTYYIKGCVAAFRSERPEMFNLIIDQTIHLYLVMARSWNLKKHVYFRSDYISKSLSRKVKKSLFSARYFVSVCDFRLGKQNKKQLALIRVETFKKKCFLQDKVAWAFFNIYITEFDPLVDLYFVNIHAFCWSQKYCL